MMKRRRYLERMLEFRRKQLMLISKAQDEEKALIHQLIDNRNEKLMLRKQREAEENELQLDQMEVEKLVKALQGNEEEIRKDLEKKKKTAEELDKAIRKAIEEEIRKAKEEEERRKRALEEKKKKEYTELPGADLQLSKDFRTNYGKLPWPVNNGYISEPFGTHSHPELSNIKTENNGINITSTEGAYAHSVFSGTVSAIMEVPGMQSTILVKHGEYYTVYSNLVNVTVRKGDEVSVGQRLGRVYTSPSGITEFHFELWKGSVKQNPEVWLAKGI
jgi:septal ring factor EnvC (AmiA/AmiB activator)